MENSKSRTIIWLMKLIVLFLMFGIFCISTGQAADQEIPDSVHLDLDYALSLVHSADSFDPDEFSGLVEFILQTATGSTSALKERNNSSGAFHNFVIAGDFKNILDYVYNPDIPSYITMPSSLRNQKWLTLDTASALRNFPRKVETTEDIRLVRGQEREGITPDTNTGGYYSYTQDRAVALFPGPKGPVIVSATIQKGLSDVGKKGCVVGDDNNWNYLYSGVKGLNKTGIGWVDSFLYQAHSVLIYVSDSSAKTVHVGSFKWLNAGWAKINMVTSNHILEGIKRFAYNFKSVLEAPGLPQSAELAQKYSELIQYSEQKLRGMVDPYLQALVNFESSAICSNLFKKQLASGDYLQGMGREEMVRILLMEYVKENMGKKALVQLVFQKDQLEVDPYMN